MFQSWAIISLGISGSVSWSVFKIFNLSLLFKYFFEIVKINRFCEKIISP